MENMAGPRLVDGRFELLGRLGGGGMGVVWRARDTVLGREVALKEVRPPDATLAAADPAAAYQVRERVLREARALARLQHPNVVGIHHIVDSPLYPHPWLVMELVTGGSLADRLTHGPLPVPEAARIGRGLLSALRAAHTAGIVHRDVKPANVLLRSDGTPVLTDFGIAALHDATTALTASGALIGSPEYIAPERLRGHDGGPASDLWSLGMLLYVAVEGYHPLRRDTTWATLAAVLDEPVPPPARAGHLAPVLTALLDRDPAARPDPDRLDHLLATAETACHTPPPAAVADLALADPGWPETVADRIPDAMTPVPLVPGVWADQTPPPHLRPRRRRRWPVLAAVLAVVAALAWTLDSTAGPTNGAAGSAHTILTAPTTGAVTTSAAPGSTATVPADLLTPAGLRQALAAMRPVMAGTKVYQLVVYPTYAIAEVPAAANPRLYDEVDYRDGQATRTPGGTVTPDQKTVDLKQYDWNTLPALLTKAPGALKVAHPVSRYLIIEPDLFDNTPVIAVYLADAYGSGYLTATPHGTVTSTHPQGS
jgi:hypothetical protein